MQGENKQVNINNMQKITTNKQVNKHAESKYLGLLLERWWYDPEFGLNEEEVEKREERGIAEDPEVTEEGEL